jgi:hypothetical protein
VSWKPLAASCITAAVQRQGKFTVVASKFLKGDLRELEFAQNRIHDQDIIFTSPYRMADDLTLIQLSAQTRCFWITQFLRLQPPTLRRTVFDSSACRFAVETIIAEIGIDYEAFSDRRTSCLLGRVGAP